MLLNYDGELESRIGDTVRVEGSLSEIENAEYGFQIKSFYVSKGIVICLGAETAEHTGNRLTVIDRLGIMSEKISARFAVLCGEKEGSIASALLLGQRDKITDRDENNFRRLGISHILAVSGLHLSIIVSILDLALRLFTRKKYIIIPVDILATVFFAVLTGFYYSVIRVAVMMILFIIARETGQSSDSLTSIAFAAAVILLFSHQAITDCGFLLSFSSVLGLVTVDRLFLLTYRTVRFQICETQPTPPPRLFPTRKSIL